MQRWRYDVESRQDDGSKKGPVLSKAVPSLDEIMKKLNEMNDKIDRIGKI